MLRRTRSDVSPAALLIGKYPRRAAQAAAAAAMASIGPRQPTRAIQIPPVIAPATPPRLNTVIAVAPTAGPKPAVASTEGNQLKPRYTASRHEKNAAQSASVSFRKARSKIVATPSPGTGA